MGDVVGGSLPKLYTAVAGAMPFIKSQQVRAIAVSSATRVSSLPDVPTLIEAGLPEFEFNSWVGLLAPARTPRPVVDKLSAALASVVQEPAMRERLQGLGIVAVGNAPGAFAKQIADDLAKNQAVVQKAQIKID